MLQVFQGNGVDEQLGIGPRNFDDGARSVSGSVRGNYLVATIWLLKL
jgi:hypothetical protein